MFLLENVIKIFKENIILNYRERKIIFKFFYEIRMIIIIKYNNYKIKVNL